jgi:2-polyprenyl-3-methyl-5-hydroxy-6-metoxy-1,4-benzoquinol methylase
LTALAERLDTIARNYDITGDFDRYSNAYGRGLVLRTARRRSLLEVGCGWGDMTEHFAPHFDRVLALDGSEQFAGQTRERCRQYSHVEVCHVLIEDFATQERFEDIVIAHVLEHVENPVGVLTGLASFLEPGGQIHVIVPNAGSLHRRIGKAMGLLRDRHAFSGRDIQLGHMRVYDQAWLTRDVNEAGLEVVEAQGIMIKPLSNVQMQTWDPALIDALLEVGKELPELCNELYIRAGLSG